MKRAKNLVFGVVVLLVWVGCVNALLSPEERITPSDSAAATGDVFGVVLLGVIAAVIPVIFGAWLYRRYSRKPNDDK